MPLYSKCNEVPRQLLMRHSSSSEMSPIQNMYTLYYTIQVSTVVLQKSIHLQEYLQIKKDTM